MTSRESSETVPTTDSPCDTDSSEPMPADMDVVFEGVVARQVLAIVGDYENEVRSAIFNEMKSDSSGRTLIIHNDYYHANVGVQSFDDLKRVAEAVKHEKIIPGLIIRFNKMNDLEEMSQYLADLNTDMQLLVCDSDKNFACHTEVEKWAATNHFEVVYIDPSEELQEEARENAEEVGMNRIVEALNVCEWPVKKTLMKRETGVLAVDKLLKYANDMSDGEDNDDVDDPTIPASSEDYIWRSYLRANQYIDASSATTSDATTPSDENVPLTVKTQTPEPQHAERVHLSPGSQTGTEGHETPVHETPVHGTYEKHEDITISVDLDLICPLKPEEGSENSQEIQDSVTVAIPRKKKNKKKSKKYQEKED